jgi:hypothetical protein
MRKIIQDVIKGEKYITKTNVAKGNQTEVKLDVFRHNKTGGPYERLMEKFDKEIQRKVHESFEQYYQQVDKTFADIKADVERSMARHGHEDSPRHAEARKQLEQKLLPLRLKFEMLEAKVEELERGVEHIQKFEHDVIGEDDEASDDDISLFVGKATHGHKRPNSDLN